MFWLPGGAVLASGVGLLIACGGLAGSLATPPLSASAIGGGQTHPAAIQAPRDGPEIARSATITGTIATPNRSRLISGIVSIVPVEEDERTGSAAEDVEIRPDGAFTFRNVPPGRYEIRARAEVDPAGTSVVSTFRVIARGDDLDGIHLVLLPAASLQGTVLLDAVHVPKPRTLPGMRVRVVLSDGSTLGDTLTGDVGRDGEFRVRGMMPGTHHVAIDGLQHPWVLKSVMHRGRDITDTGIDAESRREYKDVRVTVTDAATDAAGVVRTAAGAPAAEATVLIMPVAEQFWTRTSRRFGRARSGEDGRYRIRGLPPGEYRAVATMDIDDEGVYRRAALRALFDAGLPLSLEPLEARAMDLVLTTGPGRTSPR